MESNSLKKNLLYNIVLSVSQLLFPIIIYAYVSRVLGPDGLGSVNFIDSFTQYFIIVAGLGIPIYGVREVAKAKNNPERLNNLVSEIFLIHIITSGLFATVFFILSLTINKLNSNFELCLIGCGILLANVFPVEWIFQGLEQFKFITKRTLLIRNISVLLVLLLVKTKADKNLYYSIMLLTICANAAINLFFLQKICFFQNKAIEFSYTS